VVGCGGRRGASLRRLLAPASPLRRFLRHVSALALLAALALAPATTARAQTGVALTYATDTSLAGQVSFYRDLGIESVPGLRGGGDFILYLPDRNELTPTLNLDLYYFELNANAQYPFYDAERYDVYALGGINYSYLVASFSDDQGNSAAFAASNEGDPGINLGVGANLVSRLGLFGELKLTLGGFNQVGLVTGVRF
jgi:hypothetical protein